jgi:hypothetical protein
MRGLGGLPAPRVGPADRVTLPTGWHAEPTFERFTDRARRVLVLAQEEARLLNHGFIGTEHILLGLIHEGDGLAAKALESLGVSLDGARERVEETIGPASPQLATSSPPFTPRAKKVLELSLREALQLGHNYIGTEHMLLGLIREGEGVAAQVLVSLGCDLQRAREVVISLLSGYQGTTVAASAEAAALASELRRHREGAVLPVGVSWRLVVVQEGRSPEAFEAASHQLAALVRSLEGEDAGELDASRVSVTSVETERGPGLHLIVSSTTPGAAPTGEAGEDLDDAPDGASDAADQPEPGPESGGDEA